VFVQACWAHHKHQYPDKLIHKEIEEFNKQCLVWWYNLSEQERKRFQEMADCSNTSTVPATSPLEGGEQINPDVANCGWKNTTATSPLEG
jgi:hypothetical protein